MHVYKRYFCSEKTNRVFSIWLKIWYKIIHSEINTLCSPAGLKEFKSWLENDSFTSILSHFFLKLYVIDSIIIVNNHFRGPKNFTVLKIPARKFLNIKSNAKSLTSAIWANVEDFYFRIVTTYFNDQQNDSWQTSVSHIFCFESNFEAHWSKITLFLLSSCTKTYLPYIPMYRYLCITIKFKDFFSTYLSNRFKYTQNYHISMIRKQYNSIKNTGNIALNS